MSVQVANIDLSTAVVGNTGKITWQNNLRPPTIAEQMQLQQPRATLFVFNDSGRWLTCKFATTNETFTIPAGAWKSVYPPAGETELDYTITASASGAQINKLFADYYAPGEAVDHIGYVGNSPVGVALSTTQQLVNDGQAPGLNIIEATPSDQPANSSWADNNDGSGFRKILSDVANPTLRTIWNFIRGNGAGTKASLQLGDALAPDILTVYAYLDQLRVGTLASPKITSDPITGALALQTGGMSQVKGQATDANSLGVAGIVAIVSRLSITVTTSQNFLSFTPTVSGLYRVHFYVRVNNGSSGQLLTVTLSWTDASGGGSISQNLTLVFGAGLRMIADGTHSIANGAFTADTVLIAAQSGNAIIVTYRDPGGTPSDAVSATVERLV